MYSPLVRSLLSTFSPAGRRGQLSILIFHRVLPELDPLFPSAITRRDFDQVILWLKDLFTLIPLSEGVDRLRRASLPSRAACITFDDGYADNYAVALPVLRRHCVPATFFVASGFVDGGRMWNDTLIEAVRRTQRESIDLEAIGLDTVMTDSIEHKRQTLKRLVPAIKHMAPTDRAQAVSIVEDQCATTLPDDLMMTTQQVRDLKSAGMDIGAHTVSHPILARCDQETARIEIADSRAQLEGIVGEKVRLFAYPNGKIGRDYTNDHVRLVSQLGFDGAVSTNAGASRYGDDLFQLRRFTPWDRQRWKFELRMAHNLIQRQDG